MLAAARAAGARRFIAQSFAGKPYAREGGWVKTEGDPLDPNPPPSYRRTLEAIRYLEFAVATQTTLEGLVLHYGYFYGPGTAIGEHGWMVNDLLAAALVFGRSFTLMMPPGLRVLRSRAARQGFIISSMMI